MKILFDENGSVKQFGCIRIKCSDEKMAQTLAACATGFFQTTAYFQKVFADFRTGVEPCFEYLFGSGAKLKISYRRDDMDCDFYIYCYSSDGMDGIRAVEELKILSSLREAFLRFHNLETALKGRDAPPSLREYFARF